MTFESPTKAILTTYLKSSALPKGTAFVPIPRGPTRAAATASRYNRPPPRLTRPTESRHTTRATGRRLGAQKNNTQKKKRNKTARDLEKVLLARPGDDLKLEFRQIYFFCDSSVISIFQ